MTNNEKQQIAQVNFDQLNLALLTSPQLEFLRDETTRLLTLGKPPAQATIDKTAYINSGGVKCPYCGSTDIEGGSREQDDNYMLQEVLCLTCSHSWTDQYTLTDIILDKAQEPDEED